VTGAEFDVIVVGGGPAGSACATVLAGRGHSVAVLERARFPREKICGDTLNPRSWELLETLGVSGELRRSQLVAVSALRVFNSRGQCARSRILPQASRSLTAVRRSLFDTVLLRHASRMGAQVFEETTAVEVEPGRWVRLKARHPGGSWTGSCRYLVGADGRNSTVARALLPRQDESGDGRIGLQWYTAAQERLTDEIHLYLLPFGYFGIVSIGPEAANLAMVLDTRRTSTGVRDIAGLLQLMRHSNSAIDRTLRDLTPLSPVQTTSPITPRPARRGRENVVLIGDAGRIVEPFTGEGIYFALRDGVTTGEELSARLGGGSAPSKQSSSGLLVNRVVSPLLRRPSLADRAVSLGAALPLLTRAATRLVARL